MNIEQQFKFQSYVNSLTKEMNIPHAIICVVNNEDTIMQIETGSSSTNEKSVFPIACCTKILTACGIHLSNLNIDIPLNSMTTTMPIFFENNYVSSNITMRDLLTHRSGLHQNSLWVYLTNDLNIYQKSDKISKLRISPFRYKYIYSNIAFSLIESYLSNIFKVHFNNFMADLIFNKANMNDTCFFDNNDLRNAINIEPNIDINKKLKNHKIFNLHSLNASSGIISSVSDICSFMKYVLQNMNKFKNIFTPNIITDRRNIYKELSQETYALGSYIQTIKGIDIIFHTGFSFGYSTFLGFIPSSKLGLFVFTNTDKSPFPSILSFELIELLTGGENNKFKRRLQLERSISNNDKDSMHNAKFEYEQNKLRNQKLYFEEFGLKGCIHICSEPIITLNNTSFSLEQIGENVFRSYIEDVNDYMIVNISDDYINISGTSDGDLIQISNFKR